MIEPETNSQLSLDDRIGIDLARKAMGSCTALIAMGVVNSAVIFRSSVSSPLARVLSVMVIIAVLARLLSLRRTLSKKVFPRKDIEFIRKTMLPLMLLIVTSTGLMLYETKFSGTTSLVPLVEMSGISVTSLFTVASHLRICRGLQTLTIGSLLVPMAFVWSHNHSADLANLSIVLIVLYAYLLIQAGTAHKQSIEKFKHEIYLEEANRELESSQLRILEETAKAENASRLASLGEMAGGIAHEINNPVAIISLIANQLEKAAQRRVLQSAKIIDATKKIDETCARVSRIIRGLRAFSRNGENDEFEEVSIGTLWGQVLDFAHGRLYNSDINIAIEHEDPEAVFECRSVQISQVLVNMLNNSVDAVHGTKDAWVHVHTRVGPDTVEFRITDSGEGIPQEIAKKIFNPFFTTKEVGRGTGLGLSISLGLIKQHRGKIALDDAAKNTSFVIELPKKRIPEKNAVVA